MKMYRAMGLAISRFPQPRDRKIVMAGVTG